MQYWLAFLNLGADLFAALGAARAAELAGVLFQLYDYMLREPVRLFYRFKPCYLQ